MAAYDKGRWYPLPFIMWSGTLRGYQEIALRIVYMLSRNNITNAAIREDFLR